jgi:hypothetical protein
MVGYGLHQQCDEARKEVAVVQPREPSIMNNKMTWSKNTQEKREAPTQTLFGMMHPIVCPLLTLVMWLEGDKDYSSLLFGYHCTKCCFESS